jgi:hypothetical protein
MGKLSSSAKARFPLTDRKTFVTDNSDGTRNAGLPPPTVMPVTHQVPSSFKALILQNQREQQNKSLYHDVRIVERPIPTLKPSEILVKINAAGFNHREVCSGITLRMGGRCGDHSLHY